jgi:Mg2+ and Co2+ transporter CorA
MSAQLCVPVLAEPFTNLSTRFMKELVPLLQDIGVSKEHIEAEMKEMQRGQITPAKNRNHLAALNDKMNRLEDHLFSMRNPTLKKVAHRIATMPFKMIGWHMPSGMVMKLFAEKDQAQPAGN